MTGIIDYNAGNTRSVERALQALGAPYVLSKDPRAFAGTDRIIFPGVGDAAYAMEQLRRTGLDSFLRDWAAGGRPLLGICLGAQIIFDWSEEGGTRCLGIIPGVIRHFTSVWRDCLFKVPHIGWNDVAYSNGGTALMQGVPSGTDFYFVHSYVICPEEGRVVRGYADYGIPVPAIVEQGNVTACQFHPEKSGGPGLRILRNFVGADARGEAASC